MSDLSRQDRIRINKDRKGIGDGKPGISDIKEGIPEFRTFYDSISGKQSIKQYIRRGARLYESDFSTQSRGDTQQTALWHLSEEVDVSSAAGTYKVLSVEAGTYVIDIRILVTTTIDSNSDAMRIDVGDGTNTDMFVDGFDGSAGSALANAILLFGSASSATEAGTKTGKFYSAEDTIDIVIGTSGTSGKIRLLVLMVKNPVITKYLGESNVK